jgi:hypothetical protein
MPATKGTAVPRHDVARSAIAGSTIARSATAGSTIARSATAGSPIARPVIVLYARAESAWVVGRHHLAARARDDRGEGVISAAIVVLIMAAIGAAMWVSFNGLWQDIRGKTEDQVEDIGSSNP